MILRNKILIAIAIIILFLVGVYFYLLGILCIGDDCQNKTPLDVKGQVANPKTQVMVDGLGADDPKYNPGSSVKFQLKLSNISGKELSKITIENTFPEYVDYSSGEGIYKSETKTLTMEINSMKPNEQKIINFSGRVSDRLPDSEKPICVSSNTKVRIGSGVSNQYSTKFCIEKNAAIVDSFIQDTFPSPATGAGALSFFFLLPSGLLGWILRKYSRK